MKMTRREVVTHLECPSKNVWSDSSSPIDHSWERMNAGLMTDGARFHPADHRLHKVLRHQSAHRSAYPENVSKWSVSIGMTHRVSGYWLFFGGGGCFFQFCGKQTPPTATGAERKRFQSSNKASLLMFYFWLSACHVPFEKSVLLVSTPAQFPEE